MKKSFLVVISLFSLLSLFPALSPAQSIVGVWDRKEQVVNTSISIEFDVDGNYIVLQDGFFVLLGVYSVSGDTVMYHDLGGPGYCDSMFHGVALYVITGNQLTLTVLNDDCMQRNVVLNTVFINHTVDVSDKLSSQPNMFALQQNYPNPFNPVTSVRYMLPSRANVNVDVYNLLGQRVDNLIDAEQSAGEYTARWDGSSSASGVYYVRMTATDKSGNEVYRSSRKILLMK